MILKIYKKLKEIALKEFSDIVADGEIVYLKSKEPVKLRLLLYDKTIADIWLSVKGKYSYHWEQRPEKDKIYRHNNAPHKKWKKIKTFPKHLHNGNEENVVESNISDDPEKGLRQFLKFVREKCR